MKNNKKNIAVIGLGYVGLPLALLAAKKGRFVIGIDTDGKKTDSLNKQVAPFADEKIAKVLKTYPIKATTDFSEIKNTSTIVICVPTPVHENHSPNFEPVKSACLNIAKHLQKGQLVILESTVNPGVSEGIVLPILEKISSLKAGRDFFLAHCPERINPGDKKWNTENIPRVVGGLEKNSLKKAVSFYKSIISAEIMSMGSLKEAEAVKVVENSFRDINIAFVNELARSFSRLEIDVVNVIKGAATKPFSFLAHYPGCGVGGHCIPVDPYYLIEYAKKNGFNHDFMALARTINNGMPKFAVELLVKGLNEKKIAVNGTKVAVLGLAYKPGIDDCRESPSFKIIKYLEEYGAKVAIFDPFVLDKSTAKNLDEALSGAKAVILATGHDEFIKLTPGYLKKKGVEVIIDGRNCLDKEKFIEAGIIYKGIGR